MKEVIAKHVRRIFDADSLPDAQERTNQTVQELKKSAPDFVSWLEENIPQCFTVSGLPPTHRKKLRTNNGLENLNRQIKRRTRVASLFPNSASLLRLVTVILAETHEDWATAPMAYLKMNDE